MARILLVDDDPDIRFVASLTLKRGKHEVVAKASGREALDFFASGGACDLIICDRMMPEMNGLQVLEELRGRKLIEGRRFVFLTAKAQTQEVAEGMKLGASGYLTKPFEPKELLSQVEQLLRPGA
jgi:two-component system, sensor histidine kinase and response regulator